MNVACHPNHLSPATEALQRVFVHGFRHLSPQIPIFHLAPHQTRPASFRSQPRGLQPTRNSRLQDEEIRSPFVQLVSDVSNMLLPPERPSGILARLDRKKFFLVQVSQPTAESPAAVCKIMEKRGVREYEKRKAKPAKNQQALMKQLELSWVIGPNDFRHKMDRLGGFLGEGRKVEVLLAKKKRGREPSADEARALVDAVKEFVRGIEGVKEYKETEGEVGVSMLMFLQGKASTKEEKEIERGQDGEKQRAVTSSMEEDRYQKGDRYSRHPKIIVAST